MYDILTCTNAQNDPLGKQGMGCISNFNGEKRLQSKPDMYICNILFIANDAARDCGFSIN